MSFEDEIIGHHCIRCDKVFDGPKSARCPNCWGHERLAKPDMEKVLDMVAHPPHYTKHPSGVECIQIAEHMSFCLGNVIKYIWRADEKGGLEDLKKARWYLEREISRRENG